MPLLKVIGKTIIWPILKTLGTQILHGLMTEGIKELEKRQNSSATKTEVEAIANLKKIPKNKVV